MNLNFKAYLKKIINKPLVSLLALYLTVTLILSLSGFYYYNYQKYIIVNERYDYLGSIAGSKMSQIIQWLKERYSDLEILRVSSPLLNLSRSELTAPATITSATKSWFESLKKFYGYDDIILIDQAGKMVYSLSSTEKYFSNTDIPLCKIASDSGIVFFSDSDERTSYQAALKFYVPLSVERNSTKKNSGVLMLVLEPQKNFEPILDHNISRSPTMESLLVKTVGDSVVYLNSFRFQPDKSESKLQAANKALISVNSVKDRKDFIHGYDYKQDEVIAVIQKVPSSAWFLITKIDKSEFYEPVTNLGKMVFLVITSGDLFFALILLFIWRKHIIRSYEKIYLTEIERLKSEKRFETLVSGVKDYSIIILDSAGIIMSWNEGTKQITGYEPDEIIGKHFSIFYSGADAIGEKLPDELIQAVDKDSFEDEGWRIKKDGSAFWANDVFTSLKDDEGRVYGFLKVTRDLTERRKVEEEIKKSRDFYLKLLDDFPNPVWRSGTDGKFNYFNKAWLKFVGSSIEQAPDERWMDNIHPNDKEKVINEYYNSFKQQKNFILEFRLKDFHGHYRWMIVFGMPHYDPDGIFLGYLGSCYDVDDRKKYEDTINTLLSISEKLYSSLEIDQISDFLITESIQLIDAESGYACLLSDSSFVVKRYYHNDHWEYFNKTFSMSDKIPQRFIANKNSYLSNAPDKDLWIDEALISKYKIRQVLSTPLFDSSGELIGFFELHNKKNNKIFNNDDVNLLRAVAHNASISITKSLNYEKLRKTEYQLRSSESELRNLAAQIQYAREAERQHIAREVHDELGQLFTGINLNISLLAELLEQNKKPSVKEILEELHSVQIFVDKGIQTVRDISGKLRSYVLDHLGIIPAIQEYCREIERISNIKCNFTSAIDSCDLDEEKNVALFRIVQEALTNVIRHAGASRIEVNVSQNRNRLDILISDNGKGIPENRSSLTGSMGILGMKERTIFLGGELNIESNSADGTKIHLSIPLE